MVWHPFDGEPATWTYAELAREAAAAAAGLAGRGVKAGDRVLIHLDNSPEFVISWYACAALGATAVTTNTRSVSDELGYYAEHCEAVAAITQPGFAELVAGAAPSVRFMVTTDDFNALLGDPDSIVDRAPDPHWPMSVQYTSGTTRGRRVWSGLTPMRCGARTSTPCTSHFAPTTATSSTCRSSTPTPWRTRCWPACG